MSTRLTCPRCSAIAKDTSKERKRFLLRHSVSGPCITPGRKIVLESN